LVVTKLQYHIVVQSLDVVYAVGGAHVALSCAKSMGTPCVLRTMQNFDFHDISGHLPKIAIRKIAIRIMNRH